MQMTAAAAAAAAPITLMAEAAEPETTASPEHEIQPAPDPTFDKEAALAEHNRALKRKLREAVAVANGCHRALQRERVEADKEMHLALQREREADKEIKRVKFHLLLETEALKKLRSNPLGVKLGPTPEEAQAFVAEKERKKKEDELWRQKSIEDSLKRALKSRHDYEKEMKRREKESALWLPKFGPKTKLHTEMIDKIYTDARAIAQTHGRNLRNFSDLREAARNPCGVSAPPTRPAGGPSP